MLRVFLPPNLGTTAPRDAIALRIDLELPAAPASPPVELLPALALLQNWLGAQAATPPPRIFVQVARSQLAALIAALHGQPRFSWANSPEKSILWIGPTLAGVSPLLSVPPAAPGALPGPSASGLRSAAPSANVQEPGKAPSSPAASIRPAPRSGGAGAAGRMVIDGSEHFLAILLPSREHPTYARALDLLKSHGFLPEPSNGKWWLRDRHKTLSFLAENRERLSADFGATFTPGFQQRTAHIGAAEVAASAQEAGGGGFDVTVGLHADGASEGELRNALLTGRRYAESAGRVFLLSPATLQRLAQAQQALSGDPAAPLAPRQTRRVPAASAAATDDLLNELAPGFQAPDTWRARSAALRDLTSLAGAPIPPALDRQLRPYQRLGVAWMFHLYRHQLGGILADEMGLGKTLQALALMLALRVSDQAVGPALVVCPASLLENWRREAVRFAPELKVFVHHGESRLAGAESAAPFDLVITSYGTLVRDETLFGAIPLGCALADEAQHLKNRRSQNARALRGLSARGRFLLTGTPLENSLEDLRSLFDFILPGYVTAPPPGVRGTDRQWFDDRLKAQTAPYILRRTKASVAPELPPRQEQVIWCELSPRQAALYRRLQETGERALIDLEAGGASDAQVRFAALTQLLRLRQLCCDPRLVERDPVTGAGTGEADRMGGPAQPRPRATPLAPPAGERTPGRGQAEAIGAAGDYRDSGKLDALRELLAQSLDDGHRVLLFSQFTQLLALLREELDAQGVPYCYLDGSMTAAARQAQVDQFQKDAAFPVFLLSLKAGGTGLNLTGADTVVHFDPWWNPAAELQATDRAHRIGQTRMVTSYKLIAAGTVEERVLGLQVEKRALLESVFSASDSASARLSLADLKGLLS